MSAVETQEVRAEASGDQSAESKAAENEDRESKSNPRRKRREPPYTRSFRGFLEQLGEDPEKFDTFRHGYWGAVRPEDAFEDDLFEDLVENRWELRRLKRVLDLASEGGIIEKSGAWFGYEGERIGQGRENARDFLKANPSISDEIETKVREKLGAKNVHVLPPTAEVPEEPEDEHVPATPTSSKARARIGAVSDRSSHPNLIFTVTGMLTALTTALISSTARSINAIAALMSSPKLPNT